MGSNQSSTIKSAISALVDINIESINENIINNRVQCSIIQDAKIVVGPTGEINIVNGNANLINQRATIKHCDLKSVVNSESSNDFQNQVSNKVDNLMESTQKSVSGFLATAFSDQQSKMDFKSELKTAIKNTFRNTNISNCSVMADISQTGDIVINGKFTIKDGNFEGISQDAAISSTAECITDNIISNLSKNTVDNIVKNVQKNEQTAEQRGPFESMAAFLNSTLGMIIAVIVLFVIVGGGGFYIYTSMNSEDKK